MASIAFDCNRLYLPTQRKLNAAWREMEDGEQVCIVPTVAWELLDKLPCAFGELHRDVVADFHERVADEAKRRSNVPTSRRYGSALSKMWWCEQMLTEDSPYRLLEIDETQDEVVRDLMESFTPDLFPGIPPEQVMNHEDARIVAECAVLGGKLILTGNMEAVNFVKASQWLEDNAHQFGIEPIPEMIQDEDAYLKRHFIDSGKVRELTKIAIGSCWPLEIPASFDQISRQVVGFCSACKGALLEETGRAVFEHWKGADDIDALLGEISANLPMAMRQSELGHPSIMGYAEFAQERGVVDANGPHPG